MSESRTPYFSWSESGINSNVAPYNSCSPNLVSIHDYIRRHWGCVSLGCHVPPPSSTKSHPYGAANDIKIRGSTNFDRAATLEAIGFLIANSAELGINTIHDYYDHQRMWKPAGVGWIYNAPIGSPGGQWIHVETTPAAFGDGRPVEAELPQPVPVPPPPEGLIVTPEDKAYLDAKFAAVYEQAHDANVKAADILQYFPDTHTQASDANIKAAQLLEDVAALSLNGIDVAVLVALLGPAITEVVAGVLNDTVLEVRPPA